MLDKRDKLSEETDGKPGIFEQKAKKKLILKNGEYKSEEIHQNGECTEFVGTLIQFNARSNLLAC